MFKYFFQKCFFFLFSVFNLVWVKSQKLRAPALDFSNQDVIFGQDNEVVPHAFYLKTYFYD